MNILQVYPEFPNFFWRLKHSLKFIRKRASAHPPGLFPVADMLPAEWEKRLVDLNVTNLMDEDLRWADYVFLSAITVQRESVRTILKRCKATGVEVVAGGPLFTMEFERYPEVDYFVLNEAEETLTPFFRYLEQDQAERIYA